MSMLNRMKIYTVHIKPGDVRAQERPIFVREGFNILALIFTLAANILIIALGQMKIFSPDSIGLLQFAIQILAGFHANDWLRYGLSKRGYIMADISTGDNLLRAEQRYFERYLAAAQ
jgi:hypothetical protein